MGDTSHCDSNASRITELYSYIVTMLALPVNIASIVGLSGSTYMAIRISRQGAMRVSRLWIVPVVTAWIVVTAHRPLDVSPQGIGLMALGFLIGMLGGWRAARKAIVSIDIPEGRFVIRSSRSAILFAIALGLVSLVLTNLFYAQMLRLTNAGLLMGLGSVCAHRLYLLFAWLRARQQTAGLVNTSSDVSEVSEKVRQEKVGQE